MASAARRVPNELPTPSDEFAAVYRTHGAFTLRLLRALGVADVALDDAVQDVFVVVHRRWSTRPEPDAMRRWIAAIARRVASHQRRSTRRWLRKLVAIAHSRVEPPASDRAEVRERLELVQRFLDGLPERQRLAFLLVEIEQMTSVEAASVLDVNVNSFNSRLAAARRAFARLRASGDDTLRSDGNG